MIQKTFDKKLKKFFDDYALSTQQRVENAIEEYSIELIDKLETTHDSGGYWMIGESYSVPHIHSINRWSSDVSIYRNSNKINLKIRNDAVNPYTLKPYVKYLTGASRERVYRSTQVPREQMLANFKEIRNDLRSAITRAIKSRKKVW